MDNQNIEYQYSMCFVAFVDILGQRENLRELPMPNPQASIAELGQQLRESAGAVLSLREGFDSQFNFQYNTQTQPSIDLPPEHQHLAEEVTKRKIGYQFFSDSLMISVSMANDNEHCTPMNGIYSSLIALAASLLTSLAKGYPIRGGIDIGPCISLRENEVYGSALERAYFLESKVADFPRIVVGNHLYDYICDVAAQSSDTVFGNMARITASSCKKLIAIDSHQRYYLDYIGPGVKEIVSRLPNLAINEGLKMAWNYALSQMDRYYCRDEKLHRRYVQLLNYLKSRITLWQ